MDFESLRIDREGHVAELVLRGPGKGNALGPAFWREMPEALRLLEADDSVRCVLLRGEGRDFTYGLDLPGMLDSLGPLIMGDNTAAERTRLHRLILSMQGATEGLARLGKPVVAALHGWCIGGGLNLVAAADIRFAEASARFSLREVKLAIVADMGALQRLPRVIGEGNTRELALTGRDFDAAEALRLGLVTKVLETPEALLAHARAAAQQVATHPPLVVQGIKQVMNYCDGKSVEDGLRYVAAWNAAFLQSQDLGEAFAAFAERRPPNFQGK